MYTVVLNDLLLVNNRRMTSVLSTMGNSPLSSGISQNLYGVIVPTGQVAVVVDVNKMVRAIADVDMTQSYITFLQTSIPSTLILENFVVSFIPKKNLGTKRYDNRVDVYDPIAREDFSVSYGNSEAPTDLDDLYFRGRANDISITYNGTDPFSPQNLLFSVNGVFHTTKVVPGTSQIFVTDGYQNMRQAKMLNVVAVDTTAVGGHTVVPITSDIVVESSSPRQEVSILLPQGTSFINKTVLLVVDGYAQILNNAYRVVNGQRMKIFTNRIDVIGNFINNPNQRFVRDLYGIANRPNPLNPEQLVPVQYDKGSDGNDQWLGIFTNARAVPMSVFQNDAFYMARLTGNHSFIVLIDNPNIFVSEFPLVTFNQTNVYENFGNETPRGLLMYGRGKVIPYTVIQASDGQHSIFTSLAETSEDLYRSDYNPDWVASSIAGGYNPSSHKRSYMIDLFSA